MRKKWFFIAPAAILGIVLFSFIGGELVMRLWNWLLPPLFGVREITFWQGFGILALCRILFGRSGGHRSGPSGIGRRIRMRMGERCQHMTPEEREQFRQRMRARWGYEPSAGESKGQ